MSRKGDHSPLDSNLLDRIGRRTTGLSVDDIAQVLSDAMKNQRCDLIGHMKRMVELERLMNSTKSEETRFYNLHARLTAAESAIRFLQKGRTR